MSYVRCYRCVKKLHFRRHDKCIQYSDNNIDTFILILASCKTFILCVELLETKRDT